MLRRRFIPNFLQIGILLNILEQSTFVGIIAVGLSLTLIAGHMDLSIESVMALAAMMRRADLRHAAAPAAASALEPAWLALAGVARRSRSPSAPRSARATRFLVVRFGINAFIVTLASYIWVRGLVVALSGGRSVYGLPDAMRDRGDRSGSLGVPLLAWMLILVYRRLRLHPDQDAVRPAPHPDRRQRHRDLSAPASGSTAT